MKEWLSMEKWKASGLDKKLLCLLVGVFLLVICIPTGKKKDKMTDYEPAETEVTIESETEVLEQRLEELLENVQGVGQVEVMITMNGEYNQIEGVVVAAEGADYPQVKQDIMEAAQALFPIAAHKIKVCKMVE